MNHSCISRRAARLLPPVLGLLAASLLAVTAAVSLLAFWHSRQQLALLDGFCTALIARAPQSADAVYALAKEGNFTAPGTPGVLSALGYRPGDFADGTGVLYAAAAAGALCAAMAFNSTLLKLLRIRTVRLSTKNAEVTVCVAALPRCRDAAWFRTFVLGAEKPPAGINTAPCAAVVRAGVWL